MPDLTAAKLLTWGSPHVFAPFCEIPTIGTDVTYPIVLAHGLCPFDLWSYPLGLDNRDGRLLDRLHYWRGVRSALRARGYRVYHSRVSWGASLEIRSKELLRNISAVLRCSGAEKVNVVAFSMGGLDARAMLFNERNFSRIHRRTASLTTISTPHLGSSYADWLLHSLGWFIRACGRAGLDLSAVRDLKVRERVEYDGRADVRDFELHCEKEIEFRSYAGRCGSPLGMLGFSSGVIERHEGENDGLVSVRSARWRGRYFRGFIEDVDHINQLGWWSPTMFSTGEGPVALLDRMRSFYLDLASSLP